jgi:hypothetical protein
MKKLILILLMLIPMPLLAQCRIGYSYDEINSEFSDLLYEGKLEGSELKMYTTFTADAKVIYFVNTDSISVATLIIPNDTFKLSGYIELYNKTYSAISSTKWKASLGNAICEVNLFYVDKNDEELLKPYFLWVEAREQ